MVLKDSFPSLMYKSQNKWNYQLYFMLHIKNSHKLSPKVSVEWQWLCPSITSISSALGFFFLPFLFSSRCSRPSSVFSCTDSENWVTKLLPHHAARHEQPEGAVLREVGMEDILHLWWETLVKLLFEVGIYLRQCLLFPLLFVYHPLPQQNSEKKVKLNLFSLT